MRILFEKSNTNIGKLGRFVDAYPYTHVSISFDNDNYLSFSRRKHHNPFDAGFMIEKMNYYAYEPEGNSDKPRACSFFSQTHGQRRFCRTADNP